MKRGRTVLIVMLVFWIIFIWAYVNYHNLTNPIIKTQDRNIIFVDVPPEPSSEPVAQENIGQVQQTPKTTATMMSALECVDRSINMVLTNIGEKEAKLSDFVIMVSGRINLNPDCGVTALKPGENTLCYNIGGVKSRGKIQVIVRSRGISEADIVECV